MRCPYDILLFPSHPIPSHSNQHPNTAPAPITTLQPRPPPARTLPPTPTPIPDNTHAILPVVGSSTSACKCGSDCRSLIELSSLLAWLTCLPALATRLRSASPP